MRRTRALAVSLTIAVGVVLAACDDVQLTSADVIVAAKAKVTARPPGARPKKLKAARGVLSGSAQPNVGAGKIGGMFVNGFGGGFFMLDFDDGSTGDNIVVLRSGSNDIVDATTRILREAFLLQSDVQLTVTEASFAGTVKCVPGSTDILRVKGKFTFSGTYVAATSDGQATVPMSGTLKVKGIGDATGVGANDN